MGVCSEAQLTAINAALGRMIASVPESTTMGVYNAVGGLMDAKVPAYLMSTVKESDAGAAYNALVDFAGVVKANPISASSASAPSNGGIDAAAGKLAAAAYPLVKGVDWTSDLYSKPIPGADPQKVTKAIGKMISMGSAADGAALKEAANAHVKAIAGMDSKGLLTQSDFQYQRWPGQGLRVGAHQQGDGRLQRGRRGGRHLGRPQQVVLHRGRKCRERGVQRSLGVQGCSEGCSALNAAVSSSV